MVDCGIVSQALDLIRGKNLLLLMDSSLEGQYANEDATLLVELASKCLQYEAKDRPDIKFLLSEVAPLQKQTEVESHVFHLKLNKNLVCSSYMRYHWISAATTNTLLISLGCISCSNGYIKNSSSGADNVIPTGKGLCKDGSYCST